MITLRQYQTDANNQIALNVGNGVRRQVYQLPTGGGKTISFSSIIQRYTSKFDKSVVVAVHRKELLSQSRKTLYNQFGIHSEAIVAGRKHIPQSKVYVGMVETLCNMLKKRQKWADHVGLLIVDEVHLGNFTKLFEYFPNAIIVGVTATPIASNKKEPLNKHFDKIVTGPQISELIHEYNSLAQNETYSLKGINPKGFGIKRGEYDQQAMGNEYSKSRNILNTVDAYEKLCEGKKTIIFNCNVEHSKLVNEAFINAGYNSRHLDGNESDAVRDDVFRWFKNTPNAILNNVGIATTGFDEPSIINVIVNKSTLSLSLWLQMCGRGSRPFKGKDFFRIIDMGGNALKHGDWSADRDWLKIFENPEKASDGSGVAPIKVCEGCEAIIAASAFICKYCGHEHQRNVNYDTIIADFELIVARIDVESIYKDAEDRNHKPFKPFFEILNKTITTLKYRGGVGMDDEYYIKAYQHFETKIKEWCKLSKRSYGSYMKDFSKQQFFKQIETLNYGREITI